jgi:hypothetical protein
MELFRSLASGFLFCGKNESYLRKAVEHLCSCHVTGIILVFEGWETNKD